jgi:hypothetical protein
MAKPQAKRKSPHDAMPAARPGSAPWQKSYGLYIAGSEAIDDMKLVIRRMEEKWGAGALRLLVDAQLREKFDRQRYLVNQAIWLGELEELRMQTKRMIKAYEALNRAAEAAGATVKPVDQWETVLDYGEVLVVVKTADDALRVRDDGRKKVVWSLEEVANLVDSQMAIMMAKLSFPGATVIKEDSKMPDPLDRLRTALNELDDDLSDLAVVDDCPF